MILKKLSLVIPKMSSINGSALKQIVKTFLIVKMLAKQNANLRTGLQNIEITQSEIF